MTNKNLLNLIKGLLLWVTLSCALISLIVNSLDNLWLCLLYITLAVFPLYHAVKAELIITDLLSTSESKQGYPVFKVNNKYFIGLELPLGTTEKDFHNELILLKGVYGHASSEASVRLDNHYKNHKSVLGLK